MVLSPVIVNAFSPAANAYNTQDIFTDIHHWEQTTGLTEKELLILQKDYSEWSKLVEGEDLSPEAQVQIDKLFDIWQPLAHKGGLEISELEELSQVEFK
ncbi:MAG: hypothetical protein COZ46_07840 [Verrucomicrobia bacterium CG_4_10_14_3_um_filter_43_23]|nr:MAG: hypothetical protein AUJ82_03550 [Verrucomicrobia bacterium CG1_02_43_26]PIP58940.1 MAG: hypothetical protein COX01_06155 [Verrucomicrobia bacterium CG22_combo_CG10-13_8_21_14_all_43_17]PIX57667.1 MAG: hypothetical protein COZ46_07840 [Verrucomicrobia bacterium CG_4_10_14_3_um_filter_43_23]PIY61802.1 MAG: hypothetical protein COY94_03745 [Verrucomicrobia bacterium CG_4_10_14_0_8_um_filter_43_34]PJA44751.1 MAG: hypothetical protein CO175_01305 [Verrucomicrobia bacterium CG_4_9_14_3_um_fi